MKEVIKKDRVSFGADGPSCAEPAGPGAPNPGVRLIRLDGRVHSIELTCRCGQVSVMEIEYEETRTTTEATS